MILVTFALAVVMRDILAKLLGKLELLDEDVGQSALVKTIAQRPGDLFPMEPDSMHVLVPHPLKRRYVFDRIHPAHV